MFPPRLDARYSVLFKLQVDAKRFFWNNVNVDKWVRRRLFGKLRKAVDSEKYGQNTIVLFSNFLHALCLDYAAIVFIYIVHIFL